MPTIRTMVDTATYTELVKARKKAGVPSISAFFLKNSGLLRADMMATAIVRRALARAKRKPARSRFRVKDLFPSAEWEAFPKSARIVAGAEFLREVNTAVHGIRADGKSSSNHQYYVRS